MPKVVAVDGRPVEEIDDLERLLTDPNRPD
jgi:hypothetical protein